jgi:hypothetical protein
MPDISPEASFAGNPEGPRIKELSVNAKSMCMILLLGIAAIAGLSAAGSKATDKERDGWTIFNLSYNDAANARKGKYIAIVKDESGRALNYTKLRLSCGTYMDGSLKESVVDGIISLKGKLAVSSNPYGITSLEVDLSRASEDKPWNGTLIVDGISVDVKDARGF